MMPVRSYAIRRVNPFLGVLQVVETEAGRALSTNGKSWDIQLITDPPKEWGSLGDQSGNRAWFRYGLWSEEEGLVRRPLAAQPEGDRLHEASIILIDALARQVASMPFALADQQELWLCDPVDQNPLALLASKLPGSDTPKPKPEPKYWHASLGREGASSQRRFPETGDIDEQVKRRAGFNLVRRWILRDENGGGECERTGERLPPGAFPDLLLREDWAGEEEAQRLQRYFCWIAPALLTLPALSRERRMWLEQQLNVQAISIEYHHRLYPEIIQTECIEAARVQARLQQGAST